MCSVSIKTKHLVPYRRLPPLRTVLAWLGVLCIHCSFKPFHSLIIPYAHTTINLWVIVDCKSEGDHILYRNTVRAKIAEMGHLPTYCTCAVVACLISTFLH